MKYLNKKTSPKGLAVWIIVLLVILAAVLFFPNLFTERMADSYCRNTFPVISFMGLAVSGLFMSSLTEAAVVVGGACMAVVIILIIVKFTGKVFGSNGGGAGIYAAVIFRRILIIAVIMGIVFQLMHGIAYRRTPVVEQLDMDNDDYSIEAYEEALRWAYINMLDARSRLGQDYNGVAHSAYTFESTVQHANALLDSYSEEYDLGLSPNYVRAKGVSLSRYWSLTHIVGAYDPFLAEANINTGYMDITSFAMTVTHELCHAKGYASETDCNIIAALACTRSTRADFKYAGFYYIFWDLYRVIYNNAKYNDGTIPSYLASEKIYPVYRDMAARDAYWEMIDSMFMSEEIAEISENTNDAFLKANGGGGVASYKVPEDVYLDYYMTYIKPASEAEET